MSPSFSNPFYRGTCLSRVHPHICSFWKDLPLTCFTKFSVILHVSVQMKSLNSFLYVFPSFLHVYGSHNECNPLDLYWTYGWSSPNQFCPGCRYCFVSVRNSHYYLYIYVQLWMTGLSYKNLIIQKVFSPIFCQTHYLQVSICILIYIYNIYIRTCTHIYLCIYFMNTNKFRVYYILCYYVRFYNHL